MSGGHVPSFANNPLAAAFSRERKASGLPGSQIYATTVHTPNYSGPVVGNKRDEPTYGSLRKAVMKLLSLTNLHKYINKNYKK